MWCTACQQDVPAIAVAGEETLTTQYYCARCNLLFNADSDNTNDTTFGDVRGDAGQFANEASSRPPVDVDAWDLELDALGAEHLLVTSLSRRESRWKPQDLLNDMASDWQLGGMLVPAANAKLEPKPAEKARKQSASFVGWVLILAGIMTFVCGAVLMVLSLVQARGELWRMGLPLALIGQGGLVVGLVLQLERVWQNHRRASDRLQEVDEHVSDLKMTTDLLGTTHSGPSQAFFQHMAGGANTELMLADLKGQMDLLAAQVARGRR